MQHSMREIESTLEGLTDHHIETVVSVGDGDLVWPIFCVSSRRLDISHPTVLITGGVHGDEPAGVHAALAFLRQWHRDLNRAIQFVVFPCVNPSGFEHGSLRTESGANLNRLFGIGSTQREVRAIEQWLADHAFRFRMTFDLHEVRSDYVGEGFSEKDNPRAAYLYETVTDESERLGPRMIAALPPDRTVCDWPTIYGDINDRGVISYPAGCRNPIYAMGTSLDAFLSKHYTGQSFTLETPTEWSLDDRIETHLSLLQAALEHL